MAELFIAAILGHLVGDFMLQPKYMALHKGDQSLEGFWLCTLHVAIYTVAVCAFLQTTDLLVAALVYIPHWIIDKWSLATHWTRLIRGRTFEGAYTSVDKYKSFDISFTCIVYVVNDSGMHALCLWILIKLVML